MKHILSDKKGEGHINTAVIIIIAVVIGGLLIAGLYALFAGNNGVFDQLSNEIDHMSNTGEEMQLKKENNALYYSYGGETWKNVKVTGMEEGTTIKTYLTAGEGDTLVHLIVYKMSTGMERACYSLDGIDWIPPAGIHSFPQFHHIGESNRCPQEKNRPMGKHFSKNRKETIKCV